MADRSGLARTFGASAISADGLALRLGHCSTPAAAPLVGRPRPGAAVPQRTAEDPLPPSSSRASVALLDAGEPNPGTLGPAPPRSPMPVPADPVPPQRPAAPVCGRPPSSAPTKPPDGDWAEPMASQWRREHTSKRV